MIDFNKIFDTFDNSDTNKENDDVSLLIDFSTHPLYWIGYFNKVVSNYIYFTQYMAKNFKKIAPDIKLEDTEKLGEIILYNRAWDYIKNINLANPFHVECIKLKASNTLLESLESSIYFFEQLEEYEKCILLKGIQDKVKEFTS